MDIRIPLLFLSEPPPQHPVQIDAFLGTLRNAKTVVKFIAGKNRFFVLRCFLMVAAVVLLLVVVVYFAFPVDVCLIDI